MARIHIPHPRPFSRSETREKVEFGKCWEQLTSIKAQRKSITCGISHGTSRLFLQVIHTYHPIIKTLKHASMWFKKCSYLSIQHECVLESFKSLPLCAGGDCFWIVLGPWPRCAMTYAPSLATWLYQ